MKKGRAAILLLAVMLLFTGCMGNSLRKRYYPVSYVDEICAAADRYGLDRALVAAVVKTESSFRADAVSAVGAVGLMQLMPSTAEWIAFRRGEDFVESSLYDPESNLDMGCWLLTYLIDRYDGNVKFALIAYNAGVGRMDEWQNTLLDENGDISEIPYPETRAYVSRVMDYTEKYGEIYAEEFGKTE